MPGDKLASPVSAWACSRWTIPSYKRSGEITPVRMSAKRLRFFVEAEIPQVNIDLMFAVPGQSLGSWEDTLHQVLAIKPDHVSAYNLTYEEDTEFLSRFQSGEWKQVSDDDAEYFLLAHEMLTKAGFKHYEVSNYAREETRSLHNQAYWFGADYVGIGPSAVSTFGNQRRKNVCDTDGYIRMIDQLGHAVRTLKS